MSLQTKTNPVGVDIPIQSLQEDLFNELGWTNYEAYGRAYVNISEGDTIPEVFKDGKEYLEVMYDDTVNASSFFVINSDVDYDEVANVSVDLIFQVNLAELYPNIEHRADEEMHLDVIQVIKNNFYGFNFDGFTTRIEDVYSGFDLKDDYKETTDMESFHVVRFRLNLNYEYQC